MAVSVVDRADRTGPALRPWPGRDPARRPRLSPFEAPRPAQVNTLRISAGLGRGASVTW